MPLSLWAFGSSTVDHDGAPPRSNLPTNPQSSAQNGSTGAPDSQSGQGLDTFVAHSRTLEFSYAVMSRVPRWIRRNPSLGHSAGRCTEVLVVQRAKRSKYATHLPLSLVVRPLADGLSGYLCVSVMGNLHDTGPIRDQPREL